MRLASARAQGTGMAHKALQEHLARYKASIDTDIMTYAAHVRQSTRVQYGVEAGEVVGVFLDLLERGGKRLRGALVMAAYEMCGGTDTRMIVRAATAMEMLHTYLLIIDDIQDHATLRRGGVAAHVALAQRHADPARRSDLHHIGTSLALNAALAGGHAAQMLLAGLQVDPDLRSKVLGIINHTMVVTAHGQTYDVLGQAHGDVSPEQLEHILEWKTATYTFLNPLCVGMVLAGAGCEYTDAIRKYALHAGKAYQITDDILGVFGNTATSEKDTLGDIREGKQTVLTAYALVHAAPHDAAFLRACLGDHDLTPKDLARCQRIMRESGALAAAQKAARRHVHAAIVSLEASADMWNADGVLFLRGLAESLLERTR